MVERERTRTREREPKQLTGSDLFLQGRKEFMARQNAGQVVIKKADREVQSTRQGFMRYYLDPQQFKDTPLQDWRVWTSDVRTHSGKHCHQGGLVIYVVEGKGYSIVDGEQINWETGDLLLLPMKLGGVTHQHFNTQPGKPCLWLALCHLPVMDHVATDMVQIEVRPGYVE